MPDVPGVRTYVSVCARLTCLACLAWVFVACSMCLAGLAWLACLDEARAATTSPPEEPSEEAMATPAPSQPVQDEVAPSLPVQDDALVKEDAQETQAPN